MFETCFKVCAFEAEQNPLFTAACRLTETLSVHAYCSISSLMRQRWHNNQTNNSYHCLVMSNIMMTPLQFLYTSRNSASRATSSDYNTHIQIKQMYS